MELTRHRDIECLFRQPADVHVEVAVLLFELVQEEGVETVGHWITVLLDGGCSERSEMTKERLWMRCQGQQ